MKLITLGVTTEVIMILEDQDARLWAGMLAIKIRRSQSTDAAPDYNQIVSLSIRSRIVPMLAIAQGVRHFPRAIVASAQACFRGRIVVRKIFFFCHGVRPKHLRP